MYKYLFLPAILVTLLISNNGFARGGGGGHGEGDHPGSDRGESDRSNVDNHNGNDYNARNNNNNVGNEYGYGGGGYGYGGYGPVIIPNDPESQPGISDDTDALYNSYLRDNPREPGVPN